MIDAGPAVTRFKPGDVVITHCNGEPDEFGFPLRIWAYDQPESVGWYAEEAVVGDWQIIPAPLTCGLNLWEIATLPLRAPTAYHLWRRALGKDAVAGPFLGPDNWRRISETWPDIDLSEEGLAIEIGVRLVDYIGALEPLRRARTT